MTGWSELVSTSCRHSASRPGMTITRKQTHIARSSLVADGLLRPPREALVAGCGCPHLNLLHPGADGIRRPGTNSPPGSLGRLHGGQPMATGGHAKPDQIFP